jgi:hypothetical protein
MASLRSIAFIDKFRRTGFRNFNDSDNHRNTRHSIPPIQPLENSSVIGYESDERPGNAMGALPIEQFARSILRNHES